MGQDPRVKQLSDLTKRLQSGELNLDEYRAARDALESPAAVQGKKPNKGTGPDDEKRARLVELYTSGDISREEYDKQKANLGSDGGDSKTDGKGCCGPWVWGIGALWVLAIIIFASQCSGSSSEDRAPNEYNAQAQCKRWVEERLKAPSTAKFSNEQRTPTGVGSWTISGTVDSQNSFGAMVRNDWSCKIAADGDMWRGGIKLD